MNFYIDNKIFTMLQSMVEKLCDIKVLKIDQNLHANIEGFCKASHTYSMLCWSVCLHHIFIKNLCLEVRNATLASLIVKL